MCRKTGIKTTYCKEFFSSFDKFQVFLLANEDLKQDLISFAENIF